MKQPKSSLLGIHYKGGLGCVCQFCNAPIEHAWAIHENISGKTIYLCEKHYKYWESRLDCAIKKAEEEIYKAFRDTLGGLS